MSELPTFWLKFCFFLNQTEYNCKKYDLYLRQGGYVFTWVCLSVRLFVCEQDITQKLMDRF